MKNIMVLFGGKSDEYAVSLKSAYSVIKAIDNQKYNLILVGITKQGAMYHFDGDIDLIINDQWFNAELTPITFALDGQTGIYLLSKSSWSFMPVDLVFPILHGENGEDGAIQGLLKMANLKFVGCDMYSSCVGMDKEFAHLIVAAHKIKTPKGLILYRYNYQKDDLYDINLSYPLFVKPARSGSSIGISKVASFDELFEAIELAFKYNDKIILEESIVGREVGIGIIGYDNLIVSEVDSISLSIPFFDYDDKYYKHTACIDLPAKLSDHTKKLISDSAKTIYRALNCQGLCRIDMFLDDKNELYFNEVNTMPGFTDTSRFPNLMSASGFDYSALIDIIISMALKHD